MAKRRSAAPRRRKSAPKKRVTKRAAPRKAAPKKSKSSKPKRVMSEKMKAYIARRKGAGKLYIKQDKNFGSNTVEYGPARAPAGYSDIPSNFELGA